ncbi:MAG: glutamate ligase domain-containing protein, partial [Atribacterota bacterium]
GIYRKFSNLNIKLAGRYQVENSSLAIAVTELLNQMGYLIKESNVLEALEHVKWPGRFEIIQEKPMVILDGAHNPNGVAQFTINLKQMLPKKKIIAILGIFSDKDYPGIIKNIVPFVDQVVFTMANNPRATPTRVLAREAEKYITPDKIMEKPTVDSAIHKALQIAGEDDVVCVTGSLYTVGEAEAYFLKRKNSQ